MYINTYKLDIEKLRFQADVLGSGNDYTIHMHRNPQWIVHVDSGV